MNDDLDEVEMKKFLVEQIKFLRNQQRLDEEAAREFELLKEQNLLREQVLSMDKSLDEAEVRSNELAPFEIKYKLLLLREDKDPYRNEEILISEVAVAEYQQMTELEKFKYIADEHRKHLTMLRKSTENVSSRILAESEARNAALIAKNSQLEEKVLSLTQQMAEMAPILCREVTRLAERMPAVRGRIAEDKIYALLQDSVPADCSILITRSTPCHADFTLVYRKGGRISGYALIDVKHYDGTVGSSQIGKLQRDIDHCASVHGVPPIWAAIVSIESNIAHDGIRHAPDFFWKDTRIHLVHNLLEPGDHGVSTLLSLIETGAIDVQAAHMDLCHRTLSPVLRQKREESLLGLERRCREGILERPGRTRSAGPPKSRSLSAVAIQRRQASMRQVEPRTVLSQAVLLKREVAIPEIALTEKELDECSTVAVHD